jgi:transcriptional regulator with XRE-family HTH domain
LKYPNRVKEIRNAKKNCNQTDLAEKIGMERSFLAHIESGERKIPKKYVDKLCIVLNISVDELFGHSEIERIDDSILSSAIEIVDSVVDASDLTENQRLNLLKHTYKMVKEALEKKMTNEQLEDEVNKLKLELDKEVSEIQERRRNIFNFFKKPSN